MDVARALAAHGQLPVWGSVLALSQRSGRGQLGRNWVSPEGNVYAALRLPQSHPFTGTAAAPAVGGLIAEALTHMGFAVHMKWPNDLPRREEQEEGPGWCKVGGILLEERPLPRHGETPAENLLVAGIGLNSRILPPGRPHAGAARRSGRTPLFCNKIQCLAAFRCGTVDATCEPYLFLLCRRD